MSKLLFAIQLYINNLITLFSIYRNPIRIGDPKNYTYTVKDYIALPYTAYRDTRFHLKHYY